MASGNIILYLDFDNTLSDMRELSRQYVSRLGSLLAAELGGEPAAWQAGAERSISESVAAYTSKFAGNPLAGFTQWLDEERGRAVRSVFAEVGKEIPAHEHPAALARRFQFDALTNCSALLPGAESALKQIHEMGIPIMLASTQDSEYLLAALIGAGIESYVDTKFGPDLVDCAKEGPEYYQRIIAECGIRPSEAIVVDDQAMCLDWAEEAGARVIQAALLPDSAEPEFPIVLRELVDLPRMLSSGRV